jgi:succinate-semialdehyde dehydrogenase/glutarate-semialdehyde dehydrogenase
MPLDLWFPCKLWIGGRWVDAKSGETFPVTNPATGEKLADVPRANADDATAAVEAAAKAFRQWREVSAPARGQFLRRISDILIANKERLARLLTQEQGKPIVQARGEVDYAASFYLWYAEETRRMGGRFVPHIDPAKKAWIEYHPVGVVAAVTPWNFPLAQSSKKLAAALAAGCSVVLKPASSTPVCSLAMAWVAEQAGLGKGILNVIPGSAAAIGKVICEHPAVRAISLTGSTETGAELMSAAGKHIKRTSMELGGNCPFIVFEDVPLDRAADDLIRLKFMANGQMCVTANRIFVQESIADKFVAKVKERIEKLKLADGLEEDTDIGPIIDKKAVAHIDKLVTDAVAKGAKLVAGGLASLPKKLEAGSFFPPTLLTGVTDDMQLVREEIFGPVIPVLTFSDEQEVVKRANDTEYGLAAYVYSADSARGIRVARKVWAGIVGINEMRPLRAEVPFGGLCASGVGHEGGPEGWLEFASARVFELYEAE